MTKIGPHQIEGGVGVQSVVGGDNVTVDDTDPANPVLFVDMSGAALEVRVEGAAIDSAVTSIDLVGDGIAASSDGAGNVTVTVVGGMATTGYQEVLMASGVSFPADPLESTSGGDWLYGEVTS